MPGAEVRVTEVKALKTRSGSASSSSTTAARSTRRSRRTSRPGRRGSRGSARIRFHEQERDGFTNVYLDAVERLEDETESAPAATDEVAWKTAIDAAPFLLDRKAAEQEIPPDELFDKLQPFKELVADDLRGGEHEGADADAADADAP